MDIQRKKKEKSSEVLGKNAPYTVGVWIEEAHSQQKRVFVFSHGPNVGDRNYRHIDYIPGGIPFVYYEIDNDIPFIRYLSEHPDYVEAVFAGHRHNDNITYKIDTEHIDNPKKEMCIEPPESYHELSFSKETYYILTRAST